MSLKLKEQIFEYHRKARDFKADFIISAANNKQNTQANDKLNN